MEEDNINLQSEDGALIGIVSETRGLSTSQEHLLHHTPFVGDMSASQDMSSQFEPEIPISSASQDMSSQFEPEIPISSASILILSPPDTQEVFHTPPEDHSLPSSGVDAPYCPVNQTVDVDSVSSEFVDFGKDSELGVLDGRLKNEIGEDFVPENSEDGIRVSERGVSDSDETQVKKLKLGFDSLRNSLGDQQSQSDVDGMENSEEEKLESQQSQSDLDGMANSEKEKLESQQSQSDLDGMANSEEEKLESQQSQSDLDGIANSEEEKLESQQSQSDLDGMANSEEEKLGSQQSQSDLDGMANSEEEKLESQQSQSDVDGMANSEEEKLESQQSQSDVDGMANSEEEKLESPCNVVGGEPVNDVNNDDFCSGNLLPEENVETLVVQNAGDVNLVEGNRSSREGSGIREAAVLRMLPDSIRCLLEKSTVISANGVETEKVEKKNKFSVFDVLKVLAERSVEEEKQEDGLTLLEAAKRSGMTFPRPTWWPDHMKSELFNFDHQVKK